MPILTAIDRAVLRTLIYFDLFDFPLTAEEIQENLIIKEKTTLPGVKNSLNNLKSSVAMAEGFYFLLGRDQIVKQRKEKYVLAEIKFKIALKNTKLLSHLPFIKAIFVVNKLAYSNTSNDGDIDLAIITKTDRIWSARFFCAGLMKLLNRRPQPKNGKNKICLSFYLAENNLDLESIAYPNDIHLAYWTKQFTPIFDPSNTYQNFWQENKWLNQYFANREPQKISLRRSIKSRGQKIKSIMEKIWPDFLEKLLKKIQLLILPPNLKTLAEQDNSNVLLQNNILKLHLADIRKDIEHQWQQRCQTLIPSVSVTDLIDLFKKNK